MNDPKPLRRRPRPRRAEPLQPDNPLRSDGTQPAGGTEPPDPRGDTTGAKRAREQSDAALDNVREGYGD